MTRPWWSRLLRFIGKKLMDYTDPDRWWREEMKCNEDSKTKK